MAPDRKGILGTTVFHVIVLLLLIFFGFSTPLPLPGEQGILINFGDSPRGLGRTEPSIAQPIRQEERKVPETQRTVTQPVETPALMTQDFEEAPVVQAKKEPEKKKRVEVVKEPVKVQEKKVEEKKEEVKPEVNTRALYTGRSTTRDQAGSQGITEPGGNQGSPDGSVNSDNYVGGGLGTEGVSFSLEGRGKVSLPEPSKNYQRQGVVVVEILVDRDGNVVSAREGVRGTTTSDVTMLRLAKEAALKSRFTTKGDAPVHQKGFITYVFKLN